MIPTSNPPKIILLTQVIGKSGANRKPAEMVEDDLNIDQFVDRRISSAQKAGGEINIVSE
jgi:hypothetical protein